MNDNVKYIAGAVAVVGLCVGGLMYMAYRDRVKPPEEPAVVLPPPVAAAPEEPAGEPAVRHPVPRSDEHQALPSLDDSSLPLRGALTDLIGAAPVEQFVITEDLVRHVVATIDNLPQEKVAERIRPVRRVDGPFAVQEAGDSAVLDPANYARYHAMVELFRTTDTKQLVAIYQRYYPLFQEAYANLGHPPEYFNDRLIEVIDHLLTTPEVQGPIALAQPGVLYTYADPKLEELSAGQKLLIRMGGDNATTVKNKLRELRAAVVATPSP